MIAETVRQTARQQFPSLRRPDFLFFENAGGSQVPQIVIDRVSSFFVDSYAQTGALFPESVRAEQVVSEAHQFMNQFFGSDQSGHVAFGASVTALLNLLAIAYSQRLVPGDEVIVNVHNHEAHVGPWVRLESVGIKIKFWMVDQQTGLSDMSELESLLSNRTKLVCFSATSNLLGERNDVAAITKLVHDAGAEVVLDAVAWAPHELLEVDRWQVDFCAVSMYKVFSGHVGALWGKAEKWANLTGPNHFFLANQSAKGFELGSLPYELLAGILGTGDYFASFSPHPARSRESIVEAYRAIQSLEAPLTNRLVTFFCNHPAIRVVGPTDARHRHPTLSFVPKNSTSQAIAEQAQSEGLAIKWGHMYAFRLCEALGIPPEKGVVRLSAVHVNTEEEVERAIAILDPLL